MPVEGEGEAEGEEGEDEVPAAVEEEEEEEEVAAAGGTSRVQLVPEEVVELEEDSRNSDEYDQPPFFLAPSSLLNVLYF